MIGSYRVDALVQTEAFGAIAIEVCVCHPTEQDKADYFKAINHPILEIDIAAWGQQELDALPHSLVSPIKAIRWLVPVSSETKPIVRRKARNEPLFDVRSIPLDIRPRPRPSSFTFEPNILDGQVTVERQILRTGGIVTLPSIHHEASHELAQGTYIWRELILHEDSANFSCCKQYGSAGRLQCWWMKANAGDLIVYFAPATLNDDDEQLLNAILSHPRRPVLEARELSQAPQRYALQWAHNPAVSLRRQRYDDYVSARMDALDDAMPLLTGMAIPIAVTASQRLSMPSALLQLLRADPRAFLFAVRLLALLYRRDISSLQFNDIFQSLCLNEQISLSVAEQVVATLAGYQWLEPRTGIAPDFDEKVQRVSELNPALFTFESHQAIKWSGFINEHVALLRGL
ncbi:hypothetical protein [Neiella litorisoli]|nr:hypothetical protein [Neiella litorisoli]